MSAKDILLASGAGGGWIATLATGANDTNRTNFVTRDSAGNVYACGVAYSTNDGFLVKYSPGGVLQWQKKVATTQLIRVVVSSSGDIYALGLAQAGAGYFGAQFIKFNSSGVVQWQKAYSYNLGGQFICSDLVLDLSNNIYASGYNSNTLAGAFLLKLDSSGVSQWCKKISSTSGLSGNVFINSSGEIVTNAYNVTSNGTVLLKFDSSGNLTWQRESPTGVGVQTMFVDSSDNFYLISTSAFMKLNSSASYIFQKSINATLFTECKTDSNSNIYIAGTETVSGRGTEALILKYNSSGTMQWQRIFGTTSNEAGNNVFADSNDSYLLASYTLQTNYRAIIAQLPSSGSGDGTYGGFTYTTATRTEATTSFGAFTTTTRTLSNVSFGATATKTVSDGTLTSTTVYL